MMSIPPPYNANGHTWHHPDCQMVDILLNGSDEMGDMMRRMMPAAEGTPRMPAFRRQLSPEDINAILAYIKTMWTPMQRDQQAKLARAQCP